MVKRREGKKIANIFYTFFVVLIMCMGMSHPIKVEAATAEENIKSQIISYVNGLGGYFNTNYKDKAWQCCAFCNYVWCDVLGTDMYSGTCTKYNGSGDLISFLRQCNARPGDILYGKGGSTHNMILLGYDSNGIYISDGTSSGKVWHNNGYISFTGSEYKNYYKSYFDGGFRLYRLNDSIYNKFGNPSGESGGNLVTLWGINNGDTFSGQVQLWAKRSDSDSNHYAKFYLDGAEVTGHLSSDESGYFSFYLDTYKYANGNHTLKVEYVNTQGTSTSERTIVINNVMDIQLWGINNGDTFSGQAQLWAKRSDSDSNHYAKFYLDGAEVTGHLSSDESGYFSFNLDTGNYANGSHTLKVEYVNTQGSKTDERTITIANSLEFCGFETNNRIGGNRRIQLKTNGYNQSIKIYIDGTYLQTVEKGADGYYTFWIDTCQYSQSMHNLTAKVTVNTGEIDAAIFYPVFTQEYILAIDLPSDNMIANKGDYITVSGWMNDSAQGDFYIDGNLVKTVKGLELFYREDIGYSGGYSFIYDTSSLSAGNHVLTLRASTDYRIAWDSRTFKINEEETSAPSNPSDPSDPSNPSGPSNPGEPSAPNDPSEPSNPGEPSAPSDPSDPSEPSAPSTPSTPNVPSNPSVPSTPDVSDQTNVDNSVAAVGTVVIYDGLKYKVTKAGKEVACIKLDKNSYSTVIIPSTIIHNGVTYKVTSIAKNAFKNNKKITSVTIGKNVTTIGKNAFYGCSKLKTLKIKTSKLASKKIGSKAFSKTPKSMKVTLPKKKYKTYKSMLIKKGVNKKVKFKKG